MPDESDLPSDGRDDDEPAVAFEMSDEDSEAEAVPSDVRPSRTRPTRPRVVVPPPSRSALPVALAVGVGAGVVSVLLNTAITFFNLPTFQRAAIEGNNIQSSTAYALVGLQCLNFLLTLLLCFGAGYLAGRLTAQRRPGAYAGAFAAMLTYIVSFLVRYIPNYPGNLPGSTPGVGATAGAILLTLIFIALWAVLGGLFGLWGSSIAQRSRRRPIRRRAY